MKRLDFISKRVLFFCSFSFLFFFNSCNKDNFVTENVCEYNNPYKHYGLFHNKLLGDLLKKTEGKALTPIEYKKAMESLFEDYPTIYKSDSLTIPDDTLVKGFSDCLKDNFYEMTLAYYQKGYINDVVKDKMIEFSMLIEKIKLEGVTDENLMYENLVIFENNIVNDNNISKENKETLLIFTAVTKESFKFWIDYYTQQGLYAKIPFWHILFVAGADGITLAGCMIFTGVAGLGVSGPMAVIISGLAGHVLNN